MQENTERNGNGREEKGSAEKRTRGFASMNPERQRQIASLGGRAAHAQGVAHQWTPEEARDAGRKGGQNSHGRNRDV